MKDLKEFAKRQPLIAATIAASILGILVWRGAASTGSGSIASPVATDGAPTTQTTATAEDSRIVDIETSPKASRIDPFRSVVTATQTAAATPMAVTSAPVPAGASPIQPAVMLGALHPIVPNLTAVVDRDQPKLTGITSGSPPIGVFQVGSNEEIKKVGESLSDGYVVKSINGRSAVLSRNNARITLSVSPSP